jgi:hypothetical protein
MAAVAGQQRWPGFKYQQVPGLANRHIARWLRTQRKNMRRLFAERGMLDLVERMDWIQKSRQGMMAKNRMFQKVLDDYAQRTTTGAAPKAENSQALPQPGLDVRVESTDPVDPERVRSDSSGGVPRVAGDHGGVCAEPVIEE